MNRLLVSHLLREPLFHFLLLGAALFALFSFVNKDEVRETDDRIVVSAGRIEQLANIFTKTWQRTPTRQELEGVVNDFILEEVYYRQAIEMGIDRDDTIIRRRLRQKVEFLTDDAASLVNPDDNDLGAYLAANPDKFRRDSTYTFQQVYISPDNRRGGLEAYAESQLKALRAGERLQGESGLMPAALENEPARSVDATFGRGFAAKLDGLDLGSWQGPVTSGLGVHLIKIDARQPGTVPDLADIRAAVQREWAHDRRLELRSELDQNLRSKYEIVIEWPGGEGAK